MKYRLLARHVLADQRLVEAGTVVGDDTAFPWRDAAGNELPPTTQMEGLDDASRQKVQDVHQQLYGVDPHWDRAQTPEEREAFEAAGEEQRKLDESSEPVSEQQEMEREFGVEATGVPLPGPGRQPSSTATAAPTIGGEMVPSPGPAAPLPPEPKDIRPKKPNEEQFPKG